MSHNVFKLGQLLTNSGQQWRAGVVEVLEPFGLTPSQFFMLVAIQHQQFARDHLPSQKTAANAAGLDLNVASQATKILASHYLVNRELDNDDSRAYVLSCTLAGEQLGKTASEAVCTYTEQFFEACNADALARELFKLTKQK